MLNHLALRYMPNNTVVSVAGNIQNEEVIAQIDSLFKEWTPGELSTNYASNDKQTKSRLRIEPRDNEQTHLCIAVHGFSLFHPQRFALDLLSTVLGGGMSSRLFTEIRENRGLAYDIHSYVDHFFDSGAFIIYAGVDPKNRETAVTAILEELSKLKDEITPAELTRAKELSKGRLYLRLENTQNVALWHGSQEILTQQILNPDEVISIVDAISIDDLQQVARELLTSDRLNLATVGPSKDEPSMELLKV